MLSHFRKIIHSSSSNLVSEALSKRPIPKKKVVIDISSPEVAKIFSAGDLRSLLHGNFIQKLCRLAGYEVASVNLVRDWGPQFALLTLYWNSRRKPGEEGWPTDSEWTSQMNNREKVEFLAKVSSDARKTSRTNPAFEAKAQALFLQMERSLLSNGPLIPESALLREFHEISRDYLETHYANFGVSIDGWDSESNHLVKGMRIVKELIDKKLVVLTPEGDLWATPIQSRDDKTVAFCRGDGSSLNITRELGAICERDETFNADQYFYVAEKREAPHFAKLKLALETIGRSELAQKIVTCHTGTVVGLQTNKGKVDSVDFLLEQGEKEAGKHLKINSSESSSTIEQELFYSEFCSQLTRSTIVFDLMKKEIHSDYSFTFKRAFDVDLNSAHFLQDKYVLLNNLELANPEHMERIRAMDDHTERRLVLEMNKPAQALSQKIYEFDTVVYSSFEQMDVSFLTLYLIKLANQIEKALPILKVYGEPKEEALPRLILFSASKKILGEGMRLIGIEPIVGPS